MSEPVSQPVPWNPAANPDPDWQGDGDPDEGVWVLTLDDREDPDNRGASVVMGVYATPEQAQRELASPAGFDWGSELDWVNGEIGLYAVSEDGQQTLELTRWEVTR